MHVYIYIYVHVYIYIYIHIHITYIYIYTYNIYRQRDYYVTCCGSIAIAPPSAQTPWKVEMSGSRPSHPAAPWKLQKPPASTGAEMPNHPQYVRGSVELMTHVSYIYIYNDITYHLL